jgi:beta-glucosidase
VASAIYPHHPEEDTEIVECAHQLINELFLSPAMRGVYPTHLTGIMAASGPSWLHDDLEPMGRRIDFVGINNHTRRFVTRSRDSQFPFELVPSDAPASRKTDMGCEIFPKGLREVLNRIREDYDNPVVYVTENGAAFTDLKDPDGRIRDTRRTGFLSDHVEQMLLAIDDGCDVRGYFVWSLLDNFEWNHGLSKRLGLVYVDFETQARTIKESGRWYSEVCRSNGLA